MFMLIFILSSIRSSMSPKCRGVCGVVPSWSHLPGRTGCWCVNFTVTCSFWGFLSFQYFLRLFRFLNSPADDRFTSSLFGALFELLGAALVDGVDVVICSSVWCVSLQRWQLSEELLFPVAKQYDIFVPSQTHIAHLESLPGLHDSGPMSGYGSTAETCRGCVPLKDIIREAILV